MSNSELRKDNIIFFVTIILLVVIFIIQIFTIVSLNNLDYKVSVMDFYGNMNSITLFESFCEEKGMNFIYITQGLYLRCANESVIKFYDIDFTYKDKINLEGEHKW